MWQQFLQFCSTRKNIFLSQSQFAVRCKKGSHCSIFLAKDGSWNLNFSIVWHLHLANHTANETPGFLQVSREENRTKMWSREQVLISWSPLLFVLRIFAIWEILVQQTCFVDFNLVETRTDYFSVTRCWNKKLMSETNFRVE